MHLREINYRPPRDLKTAVAKSAPAGFETGTCVAESRTGNNRHAGNRHRDASPTLSTNSSVHIIIYPFLHALCVDYKQLNDPVIPKTKIQLSISLIFLDFLISDFGLVEVLGKLHVQGMRLCERV
jgi:hypothetical protein